MKVKSGKKNEVIIFSDNHLTLPRQNKQTNLFIF